MSSKVDSGGIVAAAVMLPAGVAFGAGWLAWQAGKLLSAINSEADRQIAENKRRREEAAMHRKRSALAAHIQLVDLCKQLISKVDESSSRADMIDSAEFEQIKAELRDICHAAVPDDVMQIENLNSIGFLKLDNMVARHQHLSSLQIEDNNTDLYRGLSLAELMSDMKVAISAMEIQATDGKDIRAVEPTVLERVKLNKKLEDVISKITEALRYVGELSSPYGLSASTNAWLQSCFSGIDELIKNLYMPSITNAELKKGIKRLNERIDQFEMLVPSIKNTEKKFALYNVYLDASKALGEPVKNIESFDSPEALEERLQMLKKRSEEAQECAEIYRQLGQTAYICYAWDTELRALGYKVHTRKDIAEMAKYKPQNAKLGKNKLPFYHWDNDDLTQLYSMTSECSLQVIVHDDGSVTMQTISNTEDDSKTKAAQEKHCSLIAKLHENLRKNWFIMYDYNELESPDKITTPDEWFGLENNGVISDDESIFMGQRKKKEDEIRVKHSK